MNGAIVFVLICAHLVLSKDCLPSDQCSCTFDDGSGKVELASLGNKDNTPRFHDVLGSEDQKYYSYNPCGSFEEGECTNAAACEITSDKSRQTTIGEASKSAFKYDEDSGKVVVSYIAGSGVLQLTEVVLTCDPNACDPLFQPLGRQSGGSYEMHLTTVCACPDKCTATGPTNCKKSLGAGSVMLIIFFSAFIVYLIAGAIFMKFVKKAEGREVIPNVSFWAALPGLIRDGFLFVFGGCRRGSGSTYNSI